VREVWLRFGGGRVRRTPPHGGWGARPSTAEPRSPVTRCRNRASFVEEVAQRPSRDAVTRGWDWPLASGGVRKVWLRFGGGRVRRTPHGGWGARPSTAEPRSPVTRGWNRASFVEEVAQRPSRDAV